MAYLTYGKEITGYKSSAFDYMWRIPAGYLLISSPIALAGIASFARSLSAVVFLSSFVGALALLPIAISGLYYWAAAVLAAGIALQTDAWVARACLDSREDGDNWSAVCRDRPRTRHRVCRPADRR